MAKPAKGAEGTAAKGAAAKKAASPARLDPRRLPQGVLPILELPTGVYQVSRSEGAMTEPVAFVRTNGSIENPIEEWALHEDRIVALGEQLLPRIGEGAAYLFTRVGNYEPAGGWVPPGFAVKRSMWLAVVTPDFAWSLPAPVTRGLGLDQAFAVVYEGDATADFVVFAGDGTEMIVTRGNHSYPPRPPFRLVPLAAASMTTFTDVAAIHFASPQLFSVDTRNPDIGSIK